MHLIRNLIVLATIPPSAAFAAQSATVDRTIELYLTPPATDAKNYRVKLPDGTERTLANGEPHTIYFKKREVPRLTVMHPNMFLFRFSSQKGESTPTDSYTAFKTWAEPLIDAFKASDAKRSSGTTNTLLTPYAKLTITTNSGEYDLMRDLPHVSALAELARVKIPDFIQGTKAAHAGTSNVPVSPQVLEGAENILRMLDSFGSVAATEKTLAVTPSGAGAKTVDFKGRSARAVFDALRAESSLVGASDLADHLTALFDGRSELKEMIAFVKAYESDRVEALRTRDTGYFLAEDTIDLKNNKRQKVSVKANPTYAALPGIKQFQEHNARDVTLILAPKESFHLRGGVGVIYSFVENPKFEVKTASDASMTIAKKTSEANEFGGAVMLNIYPDQWWEEAVEPFVQVGYGLAKDSSGFMVGIGLSGYRELNVSAGFIYQQRRELSDGLTVGQTIAKAEDLVVRNPYKGGIYVQIGFQF